MKFIFDKWSYVVPLLELDCTTYTFLKPTKCVNIGRGIKSIPFPSPAVM